jgi:hypothetical protein
VHFRKGDFVRLLLPFVALAGVYAYVSGSTADSDVKPPPSPVVTDQTLHIVVEANMQARVGVEFEFLPAVSNMKHAPIFSANNLPTWARLDPVTGRVVGTPGTADVGQHEAIVIAVADGAQRAETAPFTIAVTGAGAGVATLEWRAPLSKVDGSILDDLAGYRIAYGRDEEALDHSIFIDDPAQTSYEFSTLESGVWYFRIVAVNRSGLEGRSSIAVRKSI